LLGGWLATVYTCHAYAVMPYFETVSCILAIISRDRWQHSKLSIPHRSIRAGLSHPKLPKLPLWKCTFNDYTLQRRGTDYKPNMGNMHWPLSVGRVGTGIGYITAISDGSGQVSRNMDLLSTLGQPDGLSKLTPQARMLEQEALLFQRDRAATRLSVEILQTIWNIPFEKDCKQQMTLKYIHQGHRNCCFQIGRISLAC